jgi:hypothetical protein
VYQLLRQEQMMVYNNNNNNNFIDLKSKLSDLVAPKKFKVIWLSKLLTLNVPGEGYSKNVSCMLN